MFSYNKLFGKMAEKGYNQTKLAKMLGISKNTFTNKVKGKATFNSIEIATLCNVLDISCEDIGEIFFTPKV